LLEEATRPGESMPIFEDANGTYIMNSKDLRAVEHVHKLVEIGVDSFKLEGRTKSVYYAARVSQTYRRAIDDAVAGRDFQPQLITELEKLSSRGYTSGFYQRHNHADYQNYESSISNDTSQIFVAEVLEQTADGMATLDIKNKLSVGDRLELVTPTGNHEITIDKMEDMDGFGTQTAPGSGYRVRTQLPADASYGLISRYL
jgi:putative protease